jgi:hypothetical protein
MKVNMRNNKMYIRFFMEFSLYLIGYGSCKKNLT